MAWRTGVVVFALLGACEPTPPGGPYASPTTPAVVVSTPFSAASGPAPVPGPVPAPVPASAPVPVPVPVPAPVPVPVPAPVPGPAAVPAAAPAPAAVAAPATVVAPRHWALPAWLCTEPAGTIVRNRGGSSITFRMRAASGKLAWKPDQLAGSSRFRAELAAYRLSERLGYGRVPPSCERSFGTGVLANAAGADAEFVERLRRELRVGEGGRVRGAAILWVDGIESLHVFPSQVAGHPLETALSDLILFDELCGNWDRWSGGNVFADASGHELVLIDNAAGFGPIGDERRARMDRVLDLASRPSAMMLDALARLTREDVAAALSEVGYGADVVDAVIARRDRMLGRRVSAAAGAR